MKLPNLRPTDALIVPRNTPVLDCIQQMGRRNIGSILVVDSLEQEHLIGIFTERDLLRCFEKIKNRVDDFAPVDQFMTEKVMTLPLDQLHLCGELMVKKKIRHVVLTFEEELDDANKIVRIAGIVSIRDVLGQLLKIIDQRLEPIQALPKQVLLVSNTDSSRRILRSLFTKFNNVDFVVLESDANFLVEKAIETDCLFVDLDRFMAQHWVDFLRKILAEKASNQKVIVIINPMALRHQEISVLSALAEGRRIEILEKPLSLSDVIEAVNK